MDRERYTYADRCSIQLRIDEFSKDELRKMVLRLVDQIDRGEERFIPEKDPSLANIAIVSYLKNREQIQERARKIRKTLLEYDEDDLKTCANDTLNIIELCGQ